MNSYTPPVGTLLTLGQPAHIRSEIDYLALGLGPADVPELIRLLQDDELAHGDSETSEVYAQVHAWRALAQLRAVEAVEPLLDLLAEQEDEDEWDDWLANEVPVVLARIGPGVLPAVVARLEQRGAREHGPINLATALVELAKRFPGTRGEVVAQLCRVLETAAANSPALNGLVVGDLLDLKATEAWPALERAFATGNVDESIVGGAADVKHGLGLGPKPPPGTSGGWFAPPKSGSNAKQRYNERMRKKKAEKKKKKRK